MPLCQPELLSCQEDAGNRADRKKSGHVTNAFPATTQKDLIAKHQICTDGEAKLLPVWCYPRLKALLLEPEYNAWNMIHEGVIMSCSISRVEDDLKHKNHRQKSNQNCSDSPPAGSQPADYRR